MGWFKVIVQLGPTLVRQRTREGPDVPGIVPVDEFKTVNRPVDDSGQDNEGRHQPRGL